ncbi:MAG: peptidase, partial [Pseudomonadota bacterium]
MTYCVAMQLDRGLVFMSDTRTNAGIDNISTFRKMQTWCVPGERVVTVMTAGNLATTQAVISLLDERAKAPADRHPSVLEGPSMFQIARHVGDTLRDVIQDSGGEGPGQSDRAFNATMIVGGQIKGGEPRLFLIYPEGNFIEASADTPFFQIGETKYGKPILVRAYDPEMTFEEAIRLLLVSFDSTIKANLGVGLPVDVQVYEEGSLVSG